MSLMSKYLALEIAHEAAPLLLYPNPGILTTAALFFATLAESINTGMSFSIFPMMGSSISRQKAQ